MAHEDPDKVLRGVMSEIGRFISDPAKLVEATVIHARNCGIPEDVFEPIIASELRAMKGQVRDVI